VSEIKVQVLRSCVTVSTVEPLVYALLTYASLVKTSDLREKFLDPDY
jgi:hypothetical protein